MQYKVDTFNWIYLASIKNLKRILCVLHLAAGGGVGVAGGGGLVPRLAPHGHHLDGQEGGVLGLGVAPRPDQQGQVLGGGEVGAREAQLLGVRLGPPLQARGPGPQRHVGVVP